MRPIEFKCLILDRNGKIVGTFYEWLDGDGWKHDYYAPLVSNGVFSYEELGDGFLGEIKRLRFTGLTDKNGNKIFEGDKGKRPSSNGTEEKMAYGEIVFYKGSFCFHRVDSNLRITVDNLVYHYSDLEIIGNIHDNPELLNQQQ